MQERTTMRFGHFRFDPSARRLTFRGDEIHLTPKAFDLLSLLIDAAPSVLSKDVIHAELWPDHAVSDATLVSLVKELRRACSEKDPEQPLIRTVHSVGYAFEGTVEPPVETPRAAGLLFIGPRCIRLAEGTSLIGRNASCEVWIDNATVSREHARIIIGDGQVTLEDLGSKNGTRVGDESLEAPRELRDGDIIRFGEVETIFREGRSSLPTDTQASRVDFCD